MKAKRSTNNTAALNAFVSLFGQFQNQLADLQKMADNHLDVAPEEVSWPHVGDMESIVTSLQDLTDRHYHRGEYAEAI